MSEGAAVDSSVKRNRKKVSRLKRRWVSFARLLSDGLASFASQLHTDVYTLERAFAAVVINIAVWYIYMHTLTPVEKTDDYTMKCILSGAYSGKTDAHLLYCNYFLGLLLKKLTELYPSAAWLEISEHLTVFASLTALTYMIWNPKKRWQSCLMLFPVLALFGLEGYIKLTFTKVAAYAMGTGMLVFFIGLDKTGKKRIAGMTAGTLLAVVGATFRQKILISMLPVMLGILFLRALNEYLEAKTVSRETMRRAAYFFLLLLMTYAVKEAGLLFFSVDKEWGEYKLYNTYKAELQDFGWPAYKENADAYAALGISYDDYQLWVKRDYGDEDILTNELLAEVVDMKEGTGLDNVVSSLPGFLRTYPVKNFTLNVFIPGLMLGIIAILCKGRRERQAVIYLAAALMASYFYLYVGGRYNLQHLNDALMFAVTAVFIYYLRDVRLQKKQLGYLTLAAVMLFSFWIANDWDYMNKDSYSGRSISRTRSRLASSYINADKDSLYVFSNNEYYGMLRGIDTFEAVQPGQLSNNFVLSAYKYPSHNAVLKERGIENIYKGLCDDNVYYAATASKSNRELILRYLRAHYYPEATCLCVKNAFGCYIYKYSSSPFTIDLGEVKPADSSVIGDITAVASENVTLLSDGTQVRSTTASVTGKLYKAGDSSFRQRLFILARQPDGTAQLKVVRTSNLYTKSDGSRTYLRSRDDTDGLFSIIDYTIEDYAHDTEYSFILIDSQGEMYSLPLRIFESVSAE